MCGRAPAQSTQKKKIGETLLKGDLAGGVKKLKCAHAFGPLKVYP